MYLLLTAIPLVIGFGFIYFSFTKDIERDIEKQLKEKASTNQFAEKVVK